MIFGMLSCDTPNLTQDTTQADSKSSTLVILDVYRNAIDGDLSIIYSQTESVIIIKPNGLQSLDFEKVPPPPPKADRSYDIPTQNKVIIQTEILNLNEDEVNKIEKLINSLKANDLKTTMNAMKTENGIGIKIVMISSGNKKNEFSLINGATDNQRNFSEYIFEQVIQKSKLNKTELKLFLD